MDDYTFTQQPAFTPSDADFGAGVVGVELPGVYDGIAYWAYPDGRRVNRWPLTTRRGLRIQRIIDGQEPGYPND